jgi:translation initiation factor 2 subunit 1
MKKQGYPRRDEMVVCKIVKIHPNSAFAELVEYDNKTGMIHVSEVASRWVRNIREFLKEDSYIVCKVIMVEGENISLSVKRVHKEQSTSKLNEFNRDKKSEKMLELAAKSIDKTLEEAYDEVGFEMQEQFGSMTKAFEVAVKNPDLMVRKGFKDPWLKALTEIAKKSIGDKIHEVKAKLELACYSPDGVEIIKKALANAMKGKDVEIKYISAPHYTLVGRGKNYREIRKLIEDTAGAIVAEINKHKGQCQFNIEEK